MSKFCLVIGFLLSFQVSFSQESPFEIEELKDGWGQSAILKTNPKLREMDSLIKSGHFKKISSVVMAHKGKLVYEGVFN
ncbi:MAG: hypothetical protein MRZ79_00700 [Bacteroidia bacterium]|nr:hypothetical protein [Bacteroidia bacterium]